MTGGFFGNAAALLDDLFGTRSEDKNATNYVEMVQHESTLLSAQVNDADTARRICELLTAAGAQRESTLPQRGLES